MSTAATAPRWTLGDRLKKARRTAGISAKQMAETLNVSERQVRNYESAVDNIRLDVLSAYEEATGVSILWLIRGQFEGLESDVTAGYPHTLECLAA